MTDRLTLMSNMEALVKAIEEDIRLGRLKTADGAHRFVSGWVSETRREFDEDNKGGLYGA